MEFENKHWHTVIIGAGQAGLAIGYYLKMMNKEFVILDANNNIGDSWRKRWDSLKLFTPSQHNGLPGMPFPMERGRFPDKGQMADYLENYAKKFSLPVQTGIHVNKLVSRNSHFEIECTAGKVVTDRVVVATGTNPVPYIPDFASELNAEIFQIHSSQYTNSASLSEGDVLVIGAGTSGVEIAIEIAKTHKSYISGRPTFHIPETIFKYAGELYWWLISNVLTIKTPIGKKVREKIINGGAPLIRVSVADLDRAGITYLPRMTGVKNGLPQFEDESILNVSSIIWSTGFRPDFSWIELDVTDNKGWPVTNRGVSTIITGLYFIGMPFQYGLTSGLVGGVGRDAAYIFREISRH